LAAGAPNTKIGVTLGDMDGQRRGLDVGAIGIPLKAQPLIAAQNAVILRDVPRRDIEQWFGASKLLLKGGSEPGACACSDNGGGGS
jgi:hypothetical protein